MLGLLRSDPSAASLPLDAYIYYGLKWALTTKIPYHDLLLNVVC